MQNIFYFSFFLITFVACYSCDDGCIYKRESLLPQDRLTHLFMWVLQHSHTDLLDAKKKSTLLSLINDWIEAGANK